MTTKSRRKITRLPGFDYAQEGAYFITICTHNRLCLLGEVIHQEMRLNAWGRAIESEWLQTAKLRPYVSLDYYVIMPNHFHAVFFLQNHERATQRVAPTKEKFPSGPAPWSVGAIVAQFKSQVTKPIKSSGRIPNSCLWQRNYYEHVVRDEDDLNRIRQYIEDNPAIWLEDEYYSP
ncbi:MAG: transposase [Desulfobaccales bacterium]|jgi:REP element-mobilizing transposase RayT